MKITLDREDILQIAIRKIAKQLSIPHEKLTATFVSGAYQHVIEIELTPEAESKEEI